MVNMDKIWLLCRIGVDTDKPPVTLREGLNKLGRSIENETTILVSSKWVSRSHCDITVREGFVFIKDLGGMNGTFVNNIRLDKLRLTELKCGDIISLGKEYCEPIEKDHYVYRILATDKLGFYEKEITQATKRRSSTSPSREIGSPVAKRIRDVSPSILPPQVTSSVQSPTAYVDLTEDDVPPPIEEKCSAKSIQKDSSEVMIDLTSDGCSKPSFNLDITNCTSNNSSNSFKNNINNNNNNSRTGEIIQMITSLKNSERAYLKNILCQLTENNVDEKSNPSDGFFKKPSIPKIFEEKKNEISLFNDEVDCNQVNVIDSHSSGSNLQISSVISVPSHPSVSTNFDELSKEKLPKSEKNVQSPPLSNGVLEEYDLPAKFKNNLSESSDKYPFKIESNQNDIDIGIHSSLEPDNNVTDIGKGRREDQRFSFDFRHGTSITETNSGMSSLDQTSPGVRVFNISNSNDSLELMQEIQKLRKKRFGGNGIDLNLKRIESPEPMESLNMSQRDSMGNGSCIKDQSQPPKIGSPKIKDKMVEISCVRKPIQQLPSRRSSEECLNDKLGCLKPAINELTSPSALSIENISSKIVDDSSAPSALSTENMSSKILDRSSDIDTIKDSGSYLKCTNIKNSYSEKYLNLGLGTMGEGFENEQHSLENHQTDKIKRRRVSNNDPDIERIFNDLISEGSPIPNGSLANIRKSICKNVPPIENKKIQEATDNEYSYNINDIEEHIRCTSVGDSIDETTQNLMKDSNNPNFKTELPNEDLINISFSQDGAIEVDEGDTTFSSLFLDNFEEIIDLDNEPDIPNDNEFLVPIIKEEVDEMHEEAEIDLFEAHFSQCSQEVENIDKVPDVITNLDIIEEPLENKPLLVNASKCEPQINSKPYDNVTIPMDAKIESHPSCSKEHSSSISVSSGKVPALPKGLTGARLVKSTLLYKPPLPKPPVTPVKKGRKPRQKAEPEPSATKEAIAKRTKEKINEERKEKLRNLALQKKMSSDKEIKQPSAQTNKETDKDETKESAISSKNIAKITERNRGSILLEGFLENPQPRRSTRKSKEKNKVNVEVLKAEQADENKNKLKVHQTGESKIALPKLKTCFKSTRSCSSKSTTKKVKFSENVQVVIFECEGNLNKLTSSSSKDKNPLLPKQPQVRRNLDMQLDDFIFNVVHWNTSWISESKTVKGDPPIYKEVFRAKDSYVSFSDFTRWLTPMIHYELWGNMIKSFDDKTSLKSMPRFDGVVLHKAIKKSDKRLLILKCCVPLLAKEMSSLVDPMDNLLVSASAPPDWSKKLVMFGIVDSQIRVTSARGANDPFAVNYLRSLKTKYDVCAYFDIVVHNTPIRSIEPGYALMIRPTYNMMNEIRQYECLSRLQTSPLLGIVTDPEKNFSFPLPQNLEETKVVSMFPLNADQTKAVLGATHLALTSKTSISLIHGPPGTGKTRVIAAIIEQLAHFYKTKSRGNVILVCCQSNSAVDAICMRLLDVRKQLPREKRFRLTRFGRKERVHPKVVDILTTTLARNELEKANRLEDYAMEMKILRATERMLANGLDTTTSNPNEHQKNRRRYEVIQRSISLYETLLNKSATEDAKKKAIDQLVADEELKIINRTDIIATTLGSCTSRRILKALNDPSVQKDNERRSIGVCIVDEATQANEADILLPLIHGIKHFILVGDQQQLSPFVASETGKSCGYGRSLFGRLHKVWSNLKGVEDQVPIFPLRVQHRMHPEIALFPSANFYEGQLQSPEFLNINRGFKPYAVFSHRHVQDAASETNQNEAELLMTILDEVVENQLFKSLSVGVIVPYQKQKLLISEMVKNRKYHRLVDVNTIDSYQGQERDIILLSTVRTSGVGFLSDYQRLNVAITRAKRALYILGNFTSLKEPTALPACPGALPLGRNVSAPSLLGNSKAETTWKNLLADARKRGVLKELPLICRKSDVIGFLSQPVKRKRSTK